MIITDTRILDNLQVLSESKSDGTMKIRGLFQESDTPNQNKRVYPKKIMETAVNNLQEMISDNRLCGELDHPSYEIVKLQNASHRITKLECKGKDVVGEAVILPTPAGQVAQALIKGGVKLGISSRGVGSVSEGKNGISEVNDDYKMITFDLVADPSVKGAFPGLMEGKESQDNSKVVESTMKKVHGESIFIQMLENHLSEQHPEAEEGDDKKTAVARAKMKARIKAGSLSPRRLRNLDTRKGPHRASKEGQSAEQERRKGLDVEGDTKMDRIRAAFKKRQDDSVLPFVGMTLSEAGLQKLRRKGRAKGAKWSSGDEAQQTYKRNKARSKGGDVVQDTVFKPKAKGKPHGLDPLLKGMSQDRVVRAKGALKQQIAKRKKG